MAVFFLLQKTLKNTLKRNELSINEMCHIYLLNSLGLDIIIHSHNSIMNF